eukprot:tig00001056_g6639.t1
MFAAPVLMPIATASAQPCDGSLEVAAASAESSVLWLPPGATVQLETGAAGAPVRAQYRYTTLRMLGKCYAAINQTVLTEAAWLSPIDDPDLFFRSEVTLINSDGGSGGAGGQGSANSSSSPGTNSNSTRGQGLPVPALDGSAPALEQARRLAAATSALKLDLDLAAFNSSEGVRGELLSALAAALRAAVAQLRLLSYAPGSVLATVEIMHGSAAGQRPAAEILRDLQASLAAGNFTLGSRFPVLAAAAYAPLASTSGNGPVSPTSSSSSSDAALIGGLVGGLGGAALIAAVVAGAVLWRRRRAKTAQSLSSRPKTVDVAAAAPSSSPPNI